VKMGPPCVPVSQQINDILFTECCVFGSLVHTTIQIPKFSSLQAQSVFLPVVHASGMEKNIYGNAIEK